MVNIFDKDKFEDGLIEFEVSIKPVSIRSKKSREKVNLKNSIREVTNKSKYIITDTCWIAIDYFCKNVNRLKNPGAYDLDNIIKPILDALVGREGILIDDSIVDRITVNWIDTPKDDYLFFEIRHPWLNYSKKSDLVFLKSKSGWCFPISLEFYEQVDNSFFMRFFDVWNSIKSEEDYHKMNGCLPTQRFIYYNKIKDRGFEFIEID